MLRRWLIPHRRKPPDEENDQCRPDITHWFITTPVLARTHHYRDSDRAMKANVVLAPLDRVVGEWNLAGSHPGLPGRTLRGKVTFERIDGGAFLRMHSKMEDPEIPEGVAIFGTDGDDDTCTMLYFDERGVARIYDVAFHADGFNWSRDSPKFAQDFRVTIADDGRTMEGEGTMKKDGGLWEPDLRLSYARIGT